MAEEDEGADWAMGAEGVMGAEEDKGAAIYLMLDGQDTTGIGYMALWGFRAKCGTGVEWMDTPQTVTTTRAPAVLINLFFLSRKRGICPLFQQETCQQERQKPAQPWPENMELNEL